MKNCRLHLIVLVLLLVSAAKGEIYTSPDGYKFEVNLKLSKNQIMLGEPSFLDFEVKNLSDTDLGVLIGGDYRNEFGRPDSFDVRFIDSKGEILAKPRTMNFGGLISYQKIGIGNIYKVRLYYPHWATIEKTGRYKIEVKKNLAIRKYDSVKTNADYNAGGNIIELEANLEVVSADFQKMNEIIETIGKNLVESDETAQKLVPFIEDKRILKYLIPAVEKNHWLMRNLAKFNNDDALNAIISKINDNDESVRRSVSISLSLSIHPKASKFLLEMHKDKSAAIRLDVVHYLGKIKTLESTQLLKEMLDDDDKLIKQETERYLTERGEKLK